MNSRIMEEDRLEVKLCVYQRYKEIVQDKTIERRLEKTDATDLDSVDSDAMMLRRLTVRIRTIVTKNIDENIVENTDFSCAADDAEKVEVFKERLKIPNYIEKVMKNVGSMNLKVLTKDEMINLLDETVRESVGNSGKSRVGTLTELKVRKAIRKNGWQIVETNTKFLSQDIDVVAQDRNEDKITEVKIGVSSKRTNRERMRQNLIENEEVDVFVHASLGEDLALTDIEKYPNNIHVVPDDAELTDKFENSIQVQRISWLTPDNIRKFIAEL